MARINVAERKTEILFNFPSHMLAAHARLVDGVALGRTRLRRGPLWSHTDTDTASVRPTLTLPQSDPH